MERWRSTGRDYGKAFEAQLLFWAARAGLLIVSNGLQTRVLRGGKTIAVKSNLDFCLITPEGEVCFADAKSFANNYFTYSQLTPHQLQQALRYEQHKCRSGFVVHFRESASCAYFSASTIERKGPGSRFVLEDGVTLGSLRDMRIERIFTSTPSWT